MQAFLMTQSCSTELVSLWHMKVKIQMCLKGVVQIRGQFACQSDYLAFTRLHVETSKPCSAESWGRCIRGDSAVGYSAFSHLPLKFLLLVTVRQSVVDEKTQDCFLVLLNTDCFSPTMALPPCHFCLLHRLVALASQVRACLCEASP